MKKLFFLLGIFITVQSFGQFRTLVDQDTVKRIATKHYADSVAKHYADSIAAHTTIDTTVITTRAKTKLDSLVLQAAIAAHSVDTTVITTRAKTKLDSLVLQAAIAAHSVDTTVITTRAKTKLDSLVLQAAIAFRQAQLNGSGLVRVNGTTVSYDNSNYLTSIPLTNTYVGVGNGSHQLSGNADLTWDGRFFSVISDSYGGDTRLYIKNSNNNGYSQLRSQAGSTIGGIQVFGELYSGGSGVYRAGSVAIATYSSSGLNLINEHPSGFVSMVIGGYESSYEALRVNQYGHLLLGTTTDNGANLTTAKSITASSSLARGVYFNNTLVAVANNDVLVGADINPTFSNGSYTGVENYGLRVQSGKTKLADELLIANSKRIRSSGQTDYGYIELFNNATGDLTISSTYAAAAVYIGAHPTNRLMINSNGNVGVHAGNMLFWGSGGPTDPSISSNGATLEFKRADASGYTDIRFNNATATQYNLSDLNTAPASATATGTKGEIRVTTNYIYVCVATNTWVRAALTTW